MGEPEIYSAIYDISAEPFNNKEINQDQLFSEISAAYPDLVPNIMTTCMIGTVYYVFAFCPLAPYNISQIIYDHVADPNWAPARSI
jgi:hypothetical protein